MNTGQAGSITRTRRSAVPALLTAAGVVLFFILGSACRKQDNDEFVRHTNLGKAYFENRDAAKAVEHFAAAAALRPKSALALRNLMRAYLLARDHEAALETINRARALEPESPAVNYLAGLVLARLSRFEEGVSAFEEAVRLDPTSPTLRFQLATAYQSVENHDKARAQLRETVRLDHLHASAFYKLSSYARQDRDLEELERTHREFMRLRTLFGDETRSAEALETCAYTFAEATPAKPTEARESQRRQLEVRFTDVTGRVFGSDADRAASAVAVLERRADTGYTLFTNGPDGRPGLLRWEKGAPEGEAPGRFDRAAMHVEPSVTRTRARCVVGDFHNDVPPATEYDPELHAFNDVLLLGKDGLTLLKRTSQDKAIDVTAQAGLAGLTAAAARWMDYDHDGDLDLLLARTSGVELWQNNGDGTFADVSAQIGIGETGPTSDVAPADLDANVAVDFIVARGQETTLVFENQRAGRFERMPEPPGPWPPARSLIVDDFNNDGRVDTLLVSGDAALLIAGRGAERRRINLTGLTDARFFTLDFDNDGWLDIGAAGADSARPGRGSLRLWKNLRGTEWVDVTAETGLNSIETPPLVDALALDVDSDLDTDVLLLDSDERLWLLQNDGAHLQRQLHIRLVAGKSNPSAFGTHVEVRAGDFWATRSVSAVPIEIGLAGHHKLDSVQTVWTNGVVDNQIDVTPTEVPLTIVEKNVATGSCPFLYAWNGRGFRFVTDLLGNAPVGLSLHRDVMLPADPDEIVFVGRAEDLPPREDEYVLEITEEFREVLYLDHARLLAVDHPPEVEVHPTDKIMFPPFPPSEIWALSLPRAPRSALGDDGLDRTRAVREIDGVFAPPGTPLPPTLRGMCEPLGITIDFGPLDAGRPLVLALTGWLQYGDASRNIAMSQNAALKVVPPRLEAEDGKGRWISLDVVVGMPAGKTKTILCDLAGKLPPTTQRLRLTTSFEIRWDRIALCERLPLHGNYLHEALPSSARLYGRGFSDLRSRAPGHPTTPAYEIVSPYPPWRATPEGWCTRYGDVLELATVRDEKLVIINAGDALTLTFDPSAFPPVPGARVRSFFFYSVGWDKDQDYNVVTGDRIEPMPAGDSATRGGDPGDESSWRLKYNTRWVNHDRFNPRWRAADTH